jgi:hypothetical protein
MTDQQLKAYYYDTLQDGACTVTEAEFIAEAKDLYKQGLQIGLEEFTGLPTSVHIERAEMIRKAQEIGQLTFQPVALI